MDKRISIRDFKYGDEKDLIHHMSVQSLLDLKAICGRIDSFDIIQSEEASVISKTILFNGRVACCLFFVPSGDESKINMFMFSTTEAYSKISLLKEAVFSVLSCIKSLQKNKICSIVYKGNKKAHSVLKCNGFKFLRNVIFGRENRHFCLFVGE